MFTNAETNTIAALVAVGVGFYAVVAAILAMPGVTIPLSMAYALASAILATGSAFLWWAQSTNGHLEVACYTALCLPYISWGDDLSSSKFVSSPILWGHQSHLSSLIRKDSLIKGRDRSKNQRFVQEIASALGG